MRLNYVGCKQYEKRLGEFYYEENETERFDKIVNYLEKVGWTVVGGVSQWAAVVVEDYEEFKYLMADYKRAKKLINQ